MNRSAKRSIGFPRVSAVAFGAAAIALVFAWATPSSAAEGSLVKLACPSAAAADHPCKAVYFHGHDGRRHAFPNEKVYFTWYADFSGVATLSPAGMSAIPLGRNVTYRPGSKMVKFVTDPKVYAVALGGELRPIADEATARDLYGFDWNRRIDDIPDAFFPDYRFGDAIASLSQYDPSEELGHAPSIDDDLPITRRSLTVATPSGSFSVETVKLQKARFHMRTAVAEDADCDDDCAARPLAEYASEAGAAAGMHGSYFCPPDYSDCANKTNTFLSPFFDSARDRMANASSLQVHKGPMLAYSGDGVYRFFHRTKDLGSSVADFESRFGTELRGAASNYPSLVENGEIVVYGEERLESGMLSRAVRGGIGVGDRFAWLVIARLASVPDLAEIMKALGATDALNLDGGGSAALWYDGAYRFGPGRLLPNAILFSEK